MLRHLRDHVDNTLIHFPVCTYDILRRYANALLSILLHFFSGQPILFFHLASFERLSAVLLFFHIQADVLVIFALAIHLSVAPVYYF